MSGLLRAQEVIRRHQQSAPVQTIDIAQDLGIKVYKAKDWPDDISAMIRKDENGGSSGFAIYVNANHSRTRRRFSVAHEIAHYALHESLIGDGITDDALYRSKLTSAIEVQANRMAAEILMPWHLINAAMADGIETVEDLAKHFDVSKSTMSIRLGVPYEVNEVAAV
jgi:Zn-dependent peptidase ImmA (M78 family)